MYGPYGYPPMIYPPQQGIDQQKYIEFGMRQAEKLMARDAREKERAERNKERMKNEERKNNERRKFSTLLAIEWFIFGIILHPFVGAAYQALLTAAGAK